MIDRGLFVFSFQFHNSMLEARPNFYWQSDGISVAFGFWACVPWMFIADALKITVHINTELAIWVFLNRLWRYVSECLCWRKCQVQGEVPCAFEPVCWHDRIIVYFLMMLVAIGEEIDYSEIIHVSSLTETMILIHIVKSLSLEKDPWQMAISWEFILHGSLEALWYHHGLSVLCLL